MRSQGAALTVIIVLPLLPLAPRRRAASPAGLARSLVVPPAALLQRSKALKDVCKSMPWELHVIQMVALLRTSVSFDRALRESDLPRQSFSSGRQVDVRQSQLQPCIMW